MTAIGSPTRLSAHNSPAPELLTQAEAQPLTPAEFVYLSDLEPQTTDWLWQDRLALGSLALLSAAPGAGKTFLALALAAAFSRGRAPYTGDDLPPCTTLYASNEHDSAQIVHPRFAALHGEPDRLVILRTSAATAAHFPEHLEDALRRTAARFVILDPLQIWFGTSFGSSSAPVDPDRLHRLLGLAEKHHCCILLLRHLPGKGPGRPAHRGFALSGLSAALRTEFLAGASPDHPGQPALLHIKSNLGPLAPPMAYTIDSHGAFHFTGLSQLTPPDVLADRPSGAGLPKRRFAGEWLRQHLRDGSQSQYSIEVAAQRDGVCIATLKRAKFDLGVHSAKDGLNGAWYWSLPVEIK